MRRSQLGNRRWLFSSTALEASVCDRLARSCRLVNVASPPQSAGDQTFNTWTFRGHFYTVYNKNPKLLFNLLNAGNIDVSLHDEPFYFHIKVNCIDLRKLDLVMNLITRNSNIPCNRYHRLLKENSFLRNSSMYSTIIFCSNPTS